ncbi:MAG: ABC transporter substrate-binding protein [Chloroflexaceae bacterium]|nr:ABC transporter substrate-binding protein [Chloroflexaceae bacterium]
MTRLDIFAFGAFRITVDQQPIVSLTSKKAQALLVYLASYRQRAHPRTRLAGLFWPETDESHARASLRVELHKIRRALGEAGLADALCADESRVQLIPEAPIWLDSFAFSEDIAQGLRELGTRDGAARALDHFVRATALYQGDLLEGIYDEWVLGERNRLGQLYEEALRHLVSIHLGRRAFDRAIAYARLTLARNPLQEEVHRDLIYAYAASGQRSRAHAQYQACAAILREELGIEPAQETQELLMSLDDQTLPVIPFASAPTVAYDLVWPVVGRQHELMHLHQSWQQLRMGSGRLILIEGEPGVGKSRMLSAFADAVAASSLPLAKSRCYELERGIVYQPLVELVRSRPDLASSGVLGSLPPACRAGLAALFPDLVAHTDQKLPNRLERERQSDALFQLFARIAEAHGGLIVLIDDIHWADAATIEALHYIGRRLTGVPLLIICSTRDDEMPDEVRRLRASIGREVPGEHLALRRLSAPEVRTLIQHTPGAAGLTPAQHEALAMRLFAVAAGNPFFTIEILRGLVEESRLTEAARTATTGVATVPLPSSLREAIGQRLRPLNPSTRAVLNLAAVIGKGFDWPTLLRASGQDQDAVLLGLEELLSRGIIHTHDGIWYDFDHEAVRVAVYEDLALPRRRRLHGVVARALETDRDGSTHRAAELAYHYAASDQPRNAVPYLLQAGDMARRLQAYAEAEQHYQRAAMLLSEHGEGREAGDVWMKLALNAIAAGRWEAAAAFHERAFGAWDAFRLAITASVLPSSRTDAVFRLVSSFSTIGSLDPSYGASREAWRIIVQLFEGLVQLDPRMHLVPALAARWEVCDGGRVYRFHLRRDRCWSDGRPITAEDVIFAWRRNVRLAGTTSLAAPLFDIAGAEELATNPSSDPRILGVYALGPTLLEVHLRAPARHFLYTTAMPIAFPLPVHAIAAHGSAWTDPHRLVTSGPYRLAAWDPGRRIVLERSPAYRDAFPGNVGRVELLIEPSAAGRIALYQRGEVDLIAELTPQEHVWAQRFCPGNLVAHPALSTSFLAFSVHRPPFDRLAVRKAFALAIDRDRWLRIAHGVDTPGMRGGFVPPGIAGHTAELPIRFDPERARQLLAEAGYPAGRGLEGLALASVAGFDEINQYVRDQWREHLGVEVAPETVETGELIARWLDGRYPVILLARSASYPDPDNWLRYAVLGLQIVPSGDVAHTLMSKASAEGCDEVRNEYYRALDRLLVAERVVLLPLSYENHYWLARPWLSGYHFGPFSHWTPFKALQVTPH